MLGLRPQDGDRLGYFRGSLTERRRLGLAATPVSRLFGRRVSRYADSVLMADDDRSRCRAVLELSRITRLKGRGDAPLPSVLSAI